VGPQINVVGSFFPSWMLCAAIGIGVAVLARWLFLRVGVDPYLGRERSSIQASRFSSPSFSG